MRTLRAASILLAGLLGAAFGQPVVAPTPETVGSPRGEDIGGYNVTNSFEFGYRFAEVGGNLGKYRSDVNFLNGVRLLGSNLTVNSKQGHGGLFDEILLNTQGLGNDPYQFVNLRIGKNRLYRYDFMWRLNDYYNPALTIGEGRHFRNTSHTWQDQDLILLPQSKIQFRFGYSRNNQTGPALSTVQLFDSRGDEFTPFADIHRLQNEFRIGNSIEMAGFKFTWLHAWENFKEDTSFQEGAAPGSNPLDTTTLTSFRRTEPFHGNAPFWRGNLHGERKSWSMNARITYTGAQRNFALDESDIGVQRTAIDRQILVSGNASRPLTAGDFSISLFPSERLSVVNNTSVYSSRIDGNSFYDQVVNSTAAQTLVFFQYLGILTITNSTDLNYRVSPKIGFYGGYHYSTREITSVQSFVIPAFGEPPDRSTFTQDNHIHSGVFGLRLKPIHPLTVLLEGELARADRPFTPIADRNFHALRARAQYKAKTLQLSAAYTQDYNTNSVSLSTHSARARNYSVDASWVPRSWFGLDAAYAKLHLDTVSGIAFFGGGNLITGQNSIYISNLHAFNFSARIGIGKRADLFLGYAITKDTGDGRPAPVPAGTTDPVGLLLLPVQTFPLTYQAPLARLSVRITPKIRWNAGWQFFNYDEKFQIWISPQNYRANTGYTSVLWSF